MQLKVDLQGRGEITLEISLHSLLPTCLNPNAACKAFELAELTGLNITESEVAAEAMKHGSHRSIEDRRGQKSKRSIFCSLKTKGAPSMT